MAVYVIASLTIKNTIRLDDYRRTVLPTMEKYGGRLVACGGPIVLEREWPRIAEFPSMERAQRWWVSPEYVPWSTQIGEKFGGTADLGYLHCGPSGAGHFVKMVHNGIEYGLMATYAEGFGVLRRASIGKKQTAISAETAPLRDPELYQYELNLRDIGEVWRRGAVIASGLLDLTAAALIEGETLSKFTGRVSDSGEGRWTIMPPSMKAYRHRCFRRGSMGASVHAERRIIRTNCCRHALSVRRPRRSARCQAGRLKNLLAHLFIFFV